MVPPLAVLETAMEMIWRGTLAFELVHVPIRLYKATRKRRIAFRLLHEPDHSPIRLRRVCEEEDREVPDDEIVRGYPLEDGWIVMDDEELERAAPRLTRSVRIRDFVAEHEVDPVLYRSPYYIAPEPGAEEPYVMLREAIRRSGKVGVAEFVLMHREHLAVIRAGEEALLVETLHYPEELIDERELEVPAQTRLREGEIRMATDLIRNLSRTFDPSRYRNDYRARVLELLRGKAQGRLPERLELPPPPEPTPVVDLTRRLRESLDRLGGAGRRAA